MFCFIVRRILSQRLKLMNSLYIFTLQGIPTGVFLDILIDIVPCGVIIGCPNPSAVPHDGELYFNRYLPLPGFSSKPGVSQGGGSQNITFRVPTFDPADMNNGSSLLTVNFFLHRVSGLRLVASI